MQIHQILVELAPVICDILNEAMNVTKKVTFEIPGKLWTLLELAMSEQSFDVFIVEELDKCWGMQE